MQIHLQSNNNEPIVEPLLNTCLLIGSYGIGNGPTNQKSQGDPTRMTELNDNTNKNRTLDSLMASRTNDLQNILKN